MRDIFVNSIPIGAKHPLVLIGGPCVMESEDLVMEVADKVKKIADAHNMPFIFKSSYLKDNRSSSKSFQGPGLEEGMRIMQKVKEKVGIPVLSDVHDKHSVKTAAEVLDIIQIPAYLCMQTGLTVEAAKTGKVINIKKGQFLDPHDIKNVIGKIEAEGNHNILLTERGACFGYHNLVVDMRSFKIMRELGYPVVFDVTHSIRVYGISSADPKGGAPQFVPSLARAGAAAGVDAMFIETHPDCSKALCDAASMWPLKFLDQLLDQLKRIDELVRGLGEIEYQR